MRLEIWLRFQQHIIEGKFLYEAGNEAETVNRHNRDDLEPSDLHQIN